LSFKIQKIKVIENENVSIVFRALCSSKVDHFMPNQDYNDLRPILHIFVKYISPE